MTTKNITMSDVAREAGISRQVVSDILNDRNAIKVSDATRERVLDTVRRLRYKPNYQAKSLKEGSTSCIGLMGGTTIINLRLPYFSDLAGSVDLRMLETKCPYSLLIFGASRHADRQPDFDMIRKGLVDGVILSMLSDEVDQVTNTVAPLLDKLRVPFVVIHSLAGDFPFYSVGVDFTQGMYAGTRYLTGKGYRNIRYCVRELRGRLENQCVEGFRRALTESGLAADDDALIFSPGSRIVTMYADAYRAAMEMEEIPEAIVCSTDEYALGLLHGFRNRGVRVPEDVALVARNGGLPNRMFGSELTSILHPMQEKCGAALAMLEDIMAGNSDPDHPRTETMIPGLQVGMTA